MIPITTDGLVFIVSIAIIAEFIVGIFLQGGEIFPLALASEAAMSLTVMLGVGIWAAFLRNESPTV